MPTISLRVLLLLVASCDGAFSATSPVMARDNPASAAARPAFGVSMRATSSSGASTLTTKKTVADILDDMPLGRFHAFHLLRATYIWCTLGACAELAAYIFDGVALELGATTVQSGILASAFPAGCMIGALLSAAIGDKFGRRTLLLSSSSSACLLSIGMSLSPTFGALVVLRVLSSVAWAVAFTITLVWCKLPPDAIRAEGSRLPRARVASPASPTPWLLIHLPVPSCPPILPQTPSSCRRKGAARWPTPLAWGGRSAAGW